MQRANIDDVELEYAVQGSGEALLLIGTGPIADRDVGSQKGRVPWYASSD
jgi:hypothetical protein